jgi:hypothetical protein
MNAYITETEAEKKYTYEWKNVIVILTASLAAATTATESIYVWF